MAYDPIAEYRPLLGAVASEMGPAWSLGTDPCSWEDRAVLTDGTVALAVHPDVYGRADARIRFSGVAPADHAALEQFAQHTTLWPHGTTVAATRTPGAIARQLLRTLVPPMTERAAEYAAARTRREAALLAHSEFVAAMAPFGADADAGATAAASNGHGAHKYNMRVDVGGTWGAVEVWPNGTRGDLTLHGLTAQQILNALTAIETDQLAAVVAALTAQRTA